MQPTGSHFELELNVKKDSSCAQSRISILKSYVDKGISNSFEIANLHLLGVLYFYTGRIEAAIKTFKSILINKDPKNINAHANIAFVYHRLFHSKEAKKHEQKRDEILNNADAFTRARVIAEHAYAHAFETHSEVHELLRFHQSNNLLDECLKEKLPTNPDVKLERAAWMMCKIWNFKKLFNRNYLKEQRKEKNEEFYETIMATLITIQASVPENSPLNSLAWAYFGYFFWKKPVMQYYDFRQRDASYKDIIPSALLGQAMTNMFDNPLECFERAVKINQSVEVLQMYGSWLFSESKYEEAEDIFNKAIEIDGSENNHFTYSKRGEVLLQKGIGLAEDSVNWRYLLLAIEDFNLTLRINPSAFIYHKLGQCFFLLSQNGRDEVMTLRTLEAYHNGLACQDGQSNCLLHFDYAKCLKALGEDENAIVSMRRSVENDYAESSFVQDIQLLLQWYIEKWNSDTTQGEIFLKVAYWFNMAFTKYKTKALQIMMVEMVRTNEDFFMEFKSDVCCNETKTEIKQFCLDVLKEIYGTESELVKHLSEIIEVDSNSCNIVNSTSSTLVNPMQPRNRKGFEYDFFVVHSNEDSTWVLYNLLNQLERMGSFRGIFEARDFIVGNSILDNIDWAISNSNKVVLVITPNYLQCGWCEVQMQLALITSLIDNEAGKVIPILKDGAKLPPYMRILATLTLEGESVTDSEFDILAEALDN